MYSYTQGAKTANPGSCRVSRPPAWPPVAGGPPEGGEGPDEPWSLSGLLSSSQGPTSPPLSKRLGS